MAAFKGDISFRYLKQFFLVLAESMVNSLFYLYQWWTHYFTCINGELIILPESNGELIILPLSMVNSLFYLCQWFRIQFVNDRLVQTHSIISLQFFHGFWVASFYGRAVRFYHLIRRILLYIKIYSVYVIDSDESPDSNRRQLLKSVSTDVIMSNNGLI